MIQREIYEFGPYSLDSAQMLLRRAGNVVQLQPRALETLLVLLRRRGEVVSKQELMDSVWPDSFVEEGNLTQNIFLLRRELGKTPEGEEYIQTLPKRGYRMNMPVSHSKYSAGEQGNADSGSEIAAIDPSPASAVNAKAVLAMHSARWHGRQSWLVAAWPLLAILAVFAFGIAAIVFWRMASAQPKVSGYVRITYDGAMKRGNADHVGGPDAARVRISDRQLEEVASLKEIRQAGRLAGLEFGMTPDGAPMVLKDVGTQEIYSLDWHQP